MSLIPIPSCGISPTMQDLAPTLEQLSTTQNPGEATIIIPAIALAKAAYLGEKERIETKTDLLFGIVENALNYRVYPLDVTIVKKSMELQKLSEIHDKSIVATARHLGFELITKDGKIRDSGYVPTIW